MRPFVPKPLTSGSKAEGRFGKQDFVYMAEDNTYRCPAGERLTWRFASVDDGMTLHSSWTSACQKCPLKAKCTTGKERRTKRWEHEGMLDTMQQRLDQAPETMELRRQTVEHPFGTIKAWMGTTHFLTKTLSRVSTEMSLRVMKVLGNEGWTSCARISRYLRPQRQILRPVGKISCRSRQWQRQRPRAS
jgi:hypothetical protein